MTHIDFSTYNLSELKGLHFEIEQEIRNRRQQEIKNAREQILTIAQNLGVPIEDLVVSSGGKSKTGRGGKVRAQYRNPADSTQTWTGRGRKPRWLVHALADGKSLQELKIE